MNWIEEHNKRMEESRNRKKEAGLTEKVISQMQGRWEGGSANKGRKQSEEVRKILSESKIGSKRSKESVKKSIEGTKETKWLQLLEKYPLDLILNAQNKHGNHQNNTCNELGISFKSYKKLCKHYDIEKKKSDEEKQDWAKTEQSEAVIAYHYDKSKPNGKGEYIGEYYSISEAARKLNIPKCRGHIIAVLKKRRPHTNKFYFEYKNNQ